MLNFRIALPDAGRPTRLPGTRCPAPWRLAVLLLLLLLTGSRVLAQQLKPGFDKQEYIDLMHVSAQFGSPDYRAELPVPPQYTLAYRSPTVGLENRWELYLRDDGVAVISIRGTTEASESWLANLYAAMVPAKGELTLADDFTFPYALAEDPRAAVHVGWLVSTAFLSRDLLPRLDSVYRSGSTEYLIIGHSQGGAIAYLLTAHLKALQRQGQLPADLRIKTYCSAAPKPGNLPFAYAYEAMTYGGWAYNVVNSADWVPEVPVTVQTLEDFTLPNPFTGARAMIRQQKLGKRLALGYAYNRLYKPTRRAQRNYEKILGTYTSRQVRALLPGFVPPQYYGSSDYVRTGNTVTLLADSTYRAWNTRDTAAAFAHHFHPPYLYLAERLPEGGSTKVTPLIPDYSLLSPTWELEFLSGPRIAFSGLFPDKRPRLTFNSVSKEVTGNAGCNGYSSTYALRGDQLSFGAPGPTTMMYCGEGEGLFLKTLAKVDTYAIDAEGKLRLSAGDVVLMRFAPVK